MKAFKWMPVVAAVSLAMSGCGSESKSGGRPGPTPPDPTNTYTFTFVKSDVVKADEADASCTVFERFEQNSTDYIRHYHSISSGHDSKLKGIISDSEGKLVGDLISAIGGKLIVDVLKIPEGGFFTVEEQALTSVFATTFTKDFLVRDSSLKNVSLGIYGSVSETRCLTGGNTNIVDKTNLAYINDPGNSNDTPAVGYQFASAIDSYNSNNSVIQSAVGFNAFSDEKTIIKQYSASNSKMLYQYAFEDWAKDGSFVVMDHNDATGTITNGTTGFSFPNGGLKFKAKYKNYLYELITLDDTDSDFKKPNQFRGEEWVYHLIGTSSSSSSWGVEYKGKMNTSGDFTLDESALFDAGSLATQAPTVSTFGTALNAREIDFSSSIQFSNAQKGTQRVAYRTSYSDGTYNYYVNHSIYGDVSSKVKVPELYYFDFDSAVGNALIVNNSSDFHQSYQIVADANSYPSTYVMSSFSAGNGIILSKDVNGIALSERTFNQLVFDASDDDAIILTK